MSVLIIKRAAGADPIKPYPERIMREVAKARLAVIVSSDGTATVIKNNYEHDYVAKVIDE
jgi:hypothetical protein